MPAMALRLAASAAAWLVAGALGVGAQEVTLISRDGTLRLEGLLTGHDAEVYRLRTVHGELNIAAEGVRCEGPGCPPPGPAIERLRLSGARALAEGALPVLIGGFARRHGLRVTRVNEDAHHATWLLDRADGSRFAELAVRATTTAEGFADLLAGEADIVLAQRPVTRREAAMAAEAGLGDLSRPGQARLIGLDAIVAIVSRENPLRSVAMADLLRVLDGRVTRWSELGGADLPVRLLGSDARGALAQLLRGRDRHIPVGATPGAPGDARALADAVAADPAAIALSRFSEIGNAVALALAGPCGLTSVPQREAIRAGDYPFVTRVRAYLPARRLPRIGRELLDWITSEAGQARIELAGFVGLQIESVPMARNGGRLAAAIEAAEGPAGLTALQAMLDRLHAGERLSLDLRFPDGETEPDDRARAALRLLGDRLTAGMLDGRRLVFAGFTDATGPVEINRRLSRERAEAVRRAVLAAAGRADLSAVTMEAHGFGPAMPLACDDSDWGRALNRRVEVWLRDQR